MTRFVAAGFVLLPLAVVCLAVGTVSADTAAVGDPENRLVVIGNSNPAGIQDLNLHPESQRWVFPSYIAERLDATYSASELVKGYGVVSIFGRGVTTADLRTILLFRPPPDVPLPGFRESPYFGIFELPTIEEAEKQRPEEFHTNLAVPGATLSGVLTGVEPDELANLQHEKLNGTPYFAVVDPPLVSQVDIAVFLKPKWIYIGIGTNDVSLLVDPASFETDYRTMVGRLRNASPDALIVCANVINSVNLSPGFVTASEVEGL